MDTILKLDKYSDGRWAKGCMLNWFSEMQNALRRTI